MLCHFFGGILPCQSSASSFVVIASPSQLPYASYVNDVGLRFLVDPWVNCATNYSELATLLAHKVNIWPKVDLNHWP